MRKVQEIAADIVTREGGFVDDPDDPGGATKFGVTIHTMRRLGLDLDADGDVDADDVKRLSRQRAIDIFVRHYFEKPRIATLPKVLHDTVFDMYVNAGAQAIRLLQRLLRDMGFDIAVDGAIGAQTSKAAARAAEGGAALLRDAYGIARRSYYFRLADRRPALRKFARSRTGGKGGWIRRAEEFVGARFRLTEAEFQKRTAAWD